MRDPHVHRVRYRLHAEEPLTFENPPPVEVETQAFQMRLADGTAVFAMMDHFPSVEAAQKVIEPFLRSWEFDAALRAGRSEIRFAYQDGEVIDRNPPPEGFAFAVAAEATPHSYLNAVDVSVSRNAYPPPPKQFEVTADVETLWRRYEGYLNGKEPLPALAYFCLTALEVKFGRGKKVRQRAAKEYRISGRVLAKLATLTTERGDEKTARKMRKTLRPLTPAETAWIEAALRAIIRRLAEYHGQTPLPMITMIDFPPL